MPEILLDANQSSLLSTHHETVQVRDQAGTLVGHILPNGTSQPRDCWVASWDEWYTEIEELESEDVA